MYSFGSVALGLVDRLVKPEALLAEAINTAYVKASTAQHGGLGLLKVSLSLEDLQACTAAEGGVHVARLVYTEMSSKASHS